MKHRIERDTISEPEVLADEHKVLKPKKDRRIQQLEEMIKTLRQKGIFPKSRQKKQINFKERLQKIRLNC